MQLCLVRHAIAEERGPDWPNDDLRPLTRRGRVRMAEGTRGLATLFTPEVVLTSPLVRARETTAILERRYHRARVEVEPALATGDDAALVARLRETRAATVAAVGHEPHLSHALSLLLVNGYDLRVDFGKGGAALLEFEGAPAAGAGVLLWFLRPTQLRAIGRSAAN